MRSRLVASMLFVSCLLALAPVSIGGCIVPAEDLADGDSCKEDDECKSRRCVEGSCLGSTCKQEGDDGACQGGWKCVHYDADPISGFFGASGSNRCTATCGHCPTNTYCLNEEKEGETLCRRGPRPLEVVIALPPEGSAVAGKPVTLTASLAPEGTIRSCEWQLDDNSPFRFFEGNEATLTFEDARTYRIDATCTDTTDRTGTGTATIEVKAP